MPPRRAPGRQMPYVFVHEDQGVTNKGIELLKLYRTVQK